jgi:hypothetical protein
MANRRSSPSRFAPSLQLDETVLQHDGVSDRVAGRNGTYLLHHINVVRRRCHCQIVIRGEELSRVVNRPKQTVNSYIELILYLSFISSSDYIESHRRYKAFAR